ncbi:MAG TPA: DUF3105 domain-containing protein [Actinomycetota bacterium]|nr:DUF3105 domain-containing protein [Actinomycetota bacterium]
MVDQHNTKKPAKAPKGGGAQPGAAAKQGGGARQAGTKQAAGKQAAGRQAGTKQGAAAKGKLAKGAAARREAERRRRQRTLAWTAGVVVVVLALVGLILYQGRDTSTKLTRPSAAALATAMKAAGCGDVKQFPQAGRNHIAPDKQPSNWNSNPPTSGDHLGTPLPRGIYADQQDERAAVHNLEHGYVVIQYKNLPGGQVKTLTKLAQSLRGQKLVMMPYGGLPSDGVALTAWQHSQTCQKVNVDVVSAFVDDYMLPGGAKSQAPEPLAA